MNQKKAKVCVVGDLAVGKSNLIQTYVSGGAAFTKDYNMTFGVEVYSKITYFEKEKTDVELFLFDISGQPIYETITTPVLKGMDYVVAVYDCLNQGSFVAAFEWYNKVKKANDNKSLKGCLVGTKAENKNAKEISSAEAADKASRVGLSFFEVSSALNTDVEKPFQMIAGLALGR